MSCSTGTCVHVHMYVVHVHMYVDTGIILILYRSTVQDFFLDYNTGISIHTCILHHCEYTSEFLAKYTSLLRLHF